MKDISFESVLEIIRTVEKTDVSGKRIPDAILDLIILFQGKMTKEQKRVISAEFSGYRKMLQGITGDKIDKIYENSKSDLPDETDIL
jgi:hypothetical protein